MAEVLVQLRSLSLLEALAAVLDVALVAYVFYRIFLLVQQTRAVQLINGILLLVIVAQLSVWLNLHTFNYLINLAETLLVVAIPIVFQPELRRALEQLGRGRFFNTSWTLLEEGYSEQVVEHLVAAAQRMARDRIGALMVLERKTGLRDIVETGIPVEARLTRELLVNLFVPNTPLHDGAVIVRGNRVLAAAAFLPLSESPDLTPELGGRHRAALGISEQTDALVIVVSEERGEISLAKGGSLIRHLDAESLAEMLDTLLDQEPESNGFLFWDRGGSG